MMYAVFVFMGLAICPVSFLHKFVNVACSVIHIRIGD